jgi:hypothetical protein
MRSVFVRIYLRQVREVDNDPVAPPPSFEDFRGTIELLAHRLKSSVQQTVDIVGELHRFRQSGELLNRSHFLTQFMQSIQDSD